VKEVQNQVFNGNSKVLTRSFNLIGWRASSNLERIPIERTKEEGHGKAGIACIDFQKCNRNCTDSLGRR
jgi:hypothetical protein